jgi:glycerol kinase
MRKYVLALDQGTTSSRAIVFDRRGTILSVAQQEFQQIYPKPGWVEHDPEEIWSSQLQVARAALRQANLEASDIAAIGVANQRETTVVWERSTGKPVANAIVWQSRVSTPICDTLKKEGREPLFRSKTGLVLDPYFSGTKLKHMLDTIPGLRKRASNGEVLFGTIDSFLIWRLTNGRCHVTDVSNASRTLMFSIHTLEWDDELLRILDVPRAMLPEVRATSEVYGETVPELLGSAVPIGSAVGDQQGALFGQLCLEEGSAKNTYGTGCFLLLNTGEKAAESANGMLTTVAWKLGTRTTYCLEGAVFIAGAAVQWLRDGMKAIQQSSDVGPLAEGVPHGGVYFVPAFVGMGAPYWDPYARGMLIGITRDTGLPQLSRAVVDSMAYQSREILDAMQRDSKLQLKALKVDGGASVNNDLMQFQADLLGTTVCRPKVSETTALGAAYLAGLAVGVWDGPADLMGNWALDREFKPVMANEERERLYGRWKKAVQRCLAWEEAESSTQAGASG